MTYLALEFTQAALPILYWVNTARKTFQEPVKRTRHHLSTVSMAKFLESVRQDLLQPSLENMNTALLLLPFLLVFSHISLSSQFLILWTNPLISYLSPPLLSLVLSFIHSLRGDFIGFIINLTFYIWTTIFMFLSFF